MSYRQNYMDLDPTYTDKFGDPLLRTGNLKSFADGSLGSETAWMTAPYADDPRNHGLASGDLGQRIDRPVQGVFEQVNELINRIKHGASG